MKTIKVGLVSFLIVLLLMPIGHALMILNEHLLGSNKFIGAFLMGFVGLLMVAAGVVKNHKITAATILGLLGGILVWTGWIEFSFVWIAEKLNVAPLMENGEVVTKPEYLVMMSSLGLLLTFIVLYLFSRTKCTFFSWFQRVLGVKSHLKESDVHSKPIAMITFIEVIMIMWTFYVVLLMVYDNDIAGDRHPATYIVAFGSLFWSVYLILKLLKIKKFDYAIRYAIPTVIIFWNFVEIIGRWDLMHEVWVEPTKHWFENLLILLMLVGAIAYFMYENRVKEALKKEQRMAALKQS